jgi:capsid protein
MLIRQNEIARVEPNALDRAIMWMAPVWGKQRIDARILNSYRDGVTTRMSESFAQAQGTMFGTPQERWQVMNMRDRAYTAYDNNPVAKTLVKTEVDNVIGDGVNFQATSDDEAWNRECEEKYGEWSDNCDVRGLLSAAEIQRIIWDRSRVAGDIGWALVNNDRIDRDTGILIIDSRIQVIPAENIRTPDGQVLANPNLIDGIQYDAVGRPKTFYIYYTDDRGLRQFTPITARDFVYLAHMTKPNQARPESCFATTFERLTQLDRYVDGVALAAWMATVFGLLIRQDNGAKEMQGLGTVLNSQGAEQRAITLENGSVKYVGAKGEVAQVQASQPMAQTPDFIRALMRLIGMPFDMPLEVLARDMSTVNFASARIGLIPFYRACRVRFDTFDA